MIDIDGVLMVPDDIRVERRTLLDRIAELEAALIRARERAAKSRANRKELLKHLVGHQASNRKLAGQIGGLQTMARTITRLTDELNAERRWQPIETAPLDGTIIDLLSAHRFRYPDAAFDFISPHGPTDYGWTDGNTHGSIVQHGPFTHWKPKPSTELPDGNV